MRKMYNKVFFDKDEPAGGSNGSVLSEEDFNDLFGDISPAADREELDPSESSELSEGENTDNNNEGTPEASDPSEPSAEEPSGQEPAEGKDPGPEAKGGEEPPAEPPAAPKSDEETLRETNERLLKLVNELSGGKIDLGQQQPVQPKAEGEPKPEDTPAQPSGPQLPELDMSEVFKDFDFDKVVDTKEGFMEFMSKVMATVQTQTAQGILQTLPQHVSGAVEQTTQMRKLHEDFYSTYPELVPVKGYVGQVASSIAQAEPNLTIEDVFKKTATQVKETLGLASVEQTPADATPAESTPKPKSGKPSLPGASSTKKPAPQKSGLQSEIDDLLND